MKYISPALAILALGAAPAASQSFDHIGSTVTLGYSLYEDDADLEGAVGELIGTSRFALAPSVVGELFLAFTHEEYDDSPYTETATIGGRLGYLLPRGEVGVYYHFLTDALTSAHVSIFGVDTRYEATAQLTLEGYIGTWLSEDLGDFQVFDNTNLGLAATFDFTEQFAGYATYQVDRGDYSDTFSGYAIGVEYTTPPLVAGRELILSAQVGSFEFGSSLDITNYGVFVTVPFGQVDGAPRFQGHRNLHVDYGYY